MTINPSDFYLQGTPIPSGGDENTNTYGTIPSAYMLFLAGGAHTPANATVRNNLPDSQRQAGMPVFQQDEPGFFRYLLTAGPWAHTNADWSDKYPINAINPITLATIPWKTTGQTWAIQSIQSRITTANAASTAAAFYTQSANTCVKLTAIVNGYAPSLSQSYSAEVTATYQKVGAGAPTLVGSIHSGFSDANGAWGSATFGVTGNDINVLVTGDAANSVYWATELRVQETGAP